MSENLHKELKKLKKLIDSRAPVYKIYELAKTIYDECSKYIPEGRSSSDDVKILRAIRLSANDVILHLEASPKNLDFLELERRVNYYFKELKNLQKKLNKKYNYLKW